MNDLVESAFSEELTQQGLKDLRKKYPAKLKLDMSDDAVFKAARKTRTERNNLSKLISRRRLDITDELKTYADSLIDQVAGIFDVVVIPFEKEANVRKVAAEKAEKEREELLKKECKEIAAIADFYDSSVNLTSEEIAGIIEAVDMIEVDHFDKELIHEAMEVKKTTLSKLDSLMSDVKAREILAVEREKLAEESAAAEKKAVIVERLNTLKMIPTTMFGKTSEDIIKKIASLKMFKITEGEFGILSLDAKIAVDAVVEQLSIMKSQQEMVEDAAKVKQEQAEEAERVSNEGTEQPEDDIPFVNVEDGDGGHINVIDRREDNVPRETKNDIKDNVPRETIENNLDCSVQETGTSNMSLKDAVDEWASAWTIGLPAIQELSAILKERGLI